MKIKTKDLIGAQLDWAVAKCEGWECEFSDEVSGPWLIPADGYLNDERPLSGFTPSTDWSIGGPIIEREEIGTRRNAPCSRGREWEASPSITAKGAGGRWGYGPTPLIAAMRCFCCSKFGDEVEVPDELSAI